MEIPFNKSTILEECISTVNHTIKTGKLSSDGHVGRSCEQLLNSMTHSTNLLVPSATAALEMMALLLCVKPGDEIIVPSFTFVSTANAFALRGAKIKFADNDYQGNILPSEIDRLSTSKTKAVCVVHYGGNSADMDEILTICEEKNIVLLEDAAQCVFAKYKKRPLGTLGTMGCYSFHDTKNISAGEGGSLLINDIKFRDRANFIREKGTNRKAFLEGQVDKYSWVDLGSSYCLSELNSAYLLPQLTKGLSITENRKLTWKRYSEELRPLFRNHSLEILDPPSYNLPNYHMFAFLAASSESRPILLQKLNSRGVNATFHYSPLHLSHYGKRFFEARLPVCEDFASRIVRLPLWYNMSEAEVSYVIETLKKVLS